MTTSDFLKEIDEKIRDNNGTCNGDAMYEFLRANNMSNLGTLLKMCCFSSSSSSENQEELIKLIDKEEKERNIDNYNVPLCNVGGEDDTCIRILMYCNWTDSKSLCDSWNKMSKNNNYRWNNIKIVWEEPADYYCIINCPPPGVTIPSSVPSSKIIVLQMEPHMSKHSERWGEEWANPSIEKYKFVSNHVNNYNNNEWHISKTWKQLHTENIVKDDQLNNIMSTVLSDKYNDPGHIKRIDFVKFLEKKKMNVHVYGSNKFNWKQYKGSLPYQAKDDALFPYKYTFNVENHSIKGYYTEKLIDGILSECLTVYSGCPNIKDYIDPEAYVYIEMIDFEQDYQTIKQMIEEDWHTKRLPAIRKMKNKILNNTQFFPRMEAIINQ